MIPAPIFSGAFFIVLGISFLAAVSVVLWIVALVLFPPARRSFRVYRRRSTAIFATLCVMSSFVVSMAAIGLQAEANINRERNVLAFDYATLARAASVSNLTYPAGTEVTFGV